MEVHLRELLEQGFEVAVVRDATAAAKVPEGDGYLAALINFRFIANGLWTTDEAAARIKGREIAPPRDVLTPGDRVTHCRVR
jgi:nicotinamidase-related amidase